MEFCVRLQSSIYFCLVTRCHVVYLPPNEFFSTVYFKGYRRSVCRRLDAAFLQPSSEQRVRDRGGSELRDRVRAAGVRASMEEAP